MKLKGAVTKYYIGYMGWLLQNKKINKGTHDLYIISQFNYNEYENRFISEESFRDKQIIINKIEKIDLKIEELLNEDRNSKTN